MQLKYESVGNCNTFNDLSNKACVLNKTEDLNVHVFDMITGINESQILTKHENVNVSLMEENATRIKSKLTINVNARVKNIIHVNKIIAGILLHIVGKMVNI